MRNIAYLRAFLSLLLLLTCLYLVGCSGTTPTRVTPTPPPTATSTSDTSSNNLGQPHTIPQVTCDAAAQMIQQNKVARVQFIMDKDSPEYVLSVLFNTRDSQQSEANPFGPGQYAVGPTLPKNCKSQLLAAIQAINKKLPKPEQVQVTTQPSYD